MRPLDRQTILVTGSTDGLGLELARDLAERGATLLVHGRDPARLERAVAAIGERPGAGSVIGMLADFSRLERVRGLARDVAGELDRLDGLVNNAGIALRGRERRLSEDGLELTFAVNHLAHFALTLELLPLLRASRPARVVNVASAGQRAIDFDDVQLERSYEGYAAYAQSKLAQIMFTFELAARLGDPRQSGIAVNALHPATLMETKMVRESFGRPRSRVAEGVEATLRLLADPDLDGTSGRYFDGRSESAADSQAYDAGARRRLWELSEALTGVRWPG